MFPDLFSQFDPRLSSLFKLSGIIFWGFSLFLFLPIRPSFFAGGSRVKVILGLLRYPIIRIVKGNRGKLIQGVGNYLVALFLCILFVNFSGIMP